MIVSAVGGKVFPKGKHATAQFMMGLGGGRGVAARSHARSRRGDHQFLSSRSSADSATLEAFRKGACGEQLCRGKTISIEYRWAEGRYERLPALAPS